MSLLDRNAILNGEDRPTQDVPVPEWGGTVRVREMTGDQRTKYEQLTLKRSESDGEASADNIRAIVVAACVVGEDGAPMFTQEDVAALGGRNWRALDRVFKVCIALSGANEKSTEEAAKN